MDLIQKIREVGRRRIEEATGSESDLPKERMRDGKRSFGPRVVSNTQVAPPGGSGTELDTDGGLLWTTVAGRRRKRGGPKGMQPVVEAQGTAGIK